LRRSSARAGAAIAEMAHTMATRAANPVGIPVL